MNKQYAAISADIVSSTSLSKESLVDLTQRIKQMLATAEGTYQGFWGRLVKGDSIECIMEHPKDALRVALLLKSNIKSFVPKDGIANDKFKQYGLRLAIGIGEMRIIDKELDYMDGKAIYLSGRTLANMRDKTCDSFQILMQHEVGNKALPVIAILLNHLTNKATSRQCETLFHKLQCKSDSEVASRMGISRSGVNQNLHNMGWDAIERAIKYFEQLDF
ncbi:MAG: RNA polymerase subunit sigma-70 [Muribaculaceae bacterium]|nr:RNA polymerase subunit sigma-70 [Muribaculaceae bacterium]